MNKKLYEDGLPAWHRFELITREPIRPLLPRRDCAGILLNRRLGHDRAAEADLLYAGTIHDISVAVIVECKNRPIEVSGSTIQLPDWDSVRPIDLMSQLELKADHARKFLGFEEIRFVVVGCTKLPFSKRVSPNVFAVGQPIARWANPTTEQDFTPLTSTWLDVVDGIEPLRLDSANYVKLRNLPKFAPWETEEAEQLKRDLKIERLQCELDYLMRESREDHSYREWLRGFASTREEGWFYDD